MNEQVSSILQTALPLLGIFFFAAIMWAVKMLIDRSRNIKKSIDHVWVEIWPIVGKVYSYLTPILEGGTIRIQDRHGNQFARFILTEGGAQKADWPPGKMNFVQVTLDKVILREGDSIPMSLAVRDRPILDAHQLDSLIENVAVAAAEATKISLEESGGTARKQHPFLWVYLILGVIVIGVGYLVIQQYNSSDIMNVIGETINKLGIALGIK